MTLSSITLAVLLLIAGNGRAARLVWLGRASEQLPRRARLTVLSINKRKAELTTYDADWPGQKNRLGFSQLPFEGNICVEESCAHERILTQTLRP